jgi:hypothetical protein
MQRMGFQRYESEVLEWFEILRPPQCRYLLLFFPASPPFPVLET